MLRRESLLAMMTSSHLHILGAVAPIAPMTRNEVWVCLRRLFRRRTSSSEIERIVSGFRADELAGERRVERRRERLDLNRGWVLEEDEHKANQASARLPHRHAGRAGGKQR